MEIYVSTDVETDGPIPGPNSMLSFASAAFTADGRLLDTYSANLRTLPGSYPDPKTMAWWKTQPEAWDECRTDTREPADVIPEYVAWVKQLAGTPVFVAYPAGFDFLFVYWYLIKYAGESPFSFSALDMKTLAMVAMDCDYRDATKRNMPRAWLSNRPHTHKALDDALGQGELFCNMLAAARSRAGGKT